MNAGVVSLLWVLVGVVLLVAMIVKFKINSIIALILSCHFYLPLPTASLWATLSPPWKMDWAERLSRLR